MVMAAISSHAQLTRTTVYTNLHRPVGIAQPPGVTDRMYVIEQRGISNTTRPLATTSGRISVWNPSTATEIATSLVITGVNTGSEEGLLGAAFHPNYATNGYMYVNVTVGSPSFTEIRRYTRSPGNINTFDSATVQTVLRISQPFSNHNGGTIRFGKDGFLYIGMGDGGSANDPGNRSQSVASVLGKMLRINVNGDDFPADANRNYAIPSDNPYVGITGEDEIWAVGLRNPWKWDFDQPARNGMDGLLIADVGQDVWEEANHVVADLPNVNYGWKTYEGTALTGLTGSVAIANPKFPFFTYPHPVGFSISGGTQYRGTNLGTDLWGDYMIGDYVGSWISWINMNHDLESGALLNTLTNYPTSTFTPKLTSSNLTSVESDNNGEIWVSALSNTSFGNIARLDRTAGASRSLTGTLVLNDMIFGDYSTKGVTVEIRMDAAPSTVIPLQVGVDPNGRLRIPVPTGAGRVSVNHGSWLRRTVAFNTTAASVTGINVVCVNGDVDGSGEVDAADIDEVIADFGLAGTSPSYPANRNSDLDRSGEVDAADIDIVIANFGAVDDAP